MEVLQHLYGINTEEYWAKDYFELLRSLFPVVEFQGPVWVNTLTLAYVATHAFFSEESTSEPLHRFSSCMISKGRCLEWDDFLSVYSSGELWGDAGNFRGVVYESGNKMEALGVLIKPENKNKLSQPFSSQQVIVIGDGFCRVRESLDPKDFSWAQEWEGNGIQGVIPQLHNGPYIPERRGGVVPIL